MMKLWLLSIYLFFNSSLTSLNNFSQQKTNIISFNPLYPSQANQNSQPLNLPSSSHLSINFNCCQKAPICQYWIVSPIKYSIAFCFVIIKSDKQQWPVVCSNHPLKTKILPRRIPQALRTRRCSLPRILRNKGDGLLLKPVRWRAGKTIKKSFSLLLPNSPRRKTFSYTLRS